MSILGSQLGQLGNIQASKEPHISRKIGEISGSLDELNQAIGNLSQRLDSVSNPGPRVAEGLNKAPVPSESPLAQQLGALMGRIQEASAQIRSMTAELEI